MTDLERLSSSGSAEERALLQAARVRRPSAASRQRALVALGLATTATLAPATAVALLKWSQGACGAAWRFAATKWGTGLVLAVGAAGVATGQVAMGPLEAPSQPSSGSSAVRAERPPTASGSGSSIRVVPPLVDAAEPSAASAAVAASPPKRVVVAAPSEVSLIDSARSSLTSGNPSAALALLSEHRRTYPGGSLALEARVIRIEALAASGRLPEAVGEAQRFLTQHPNGLMSHRVRRWLDRHGKL